MRGFGGVSVVAGVELAAEVLAVVVGALEEGGLPSTAVDEDALATVDVEGVAT